MLLSKIKCYLQLVIDMIDFYSPGKTNLSSQKTSPKILLFNSKSKGTQYLHYTEVYFKVQFQNEQSKTGTRI